MKPSAAAINERLSSLHSLEDVRQFVAQLGFSYRDELLPTKTLPTELSAALAQPPRIIGAAQNFLVGFVQLKATDAKDLDRHMIRWQRQMISKLPDQYQDASLLIFASDGFTRVHFVNAKRVGKRLILRRFLTGGEHKTRTAAERMQHLYLDGSEDYQRVLKLADEAFDRDKVTEQFFKSFETVFKTGKKELVAQIKDEHGAHQFLHSLLNRLMFIYFVQRKGWLADGDAEFIKTLWDMYREERDAKRVEPDTFYRDWLATLFFSAFNNKHGYEHKGLPQSVVDWFKLAPYLDGGLFMESSYDGMGFAVPDAMFERIFEDILNAYNFTVTEDTPFDQNIAVDPEMLGIVYESLVNTTELSDERAGAGIFYTPRVEVDFMCRRALVEHLAKRTSAKREDLYRFVFPEEGEEWKPSFARKLQDEIDAALVNMTVVDPACGSGAFLVGMMQVIVELRKLLWEMGGKKPDAFNDFDDRKKIIERSLYGVDVKDWAISIAQLRLWLTLIEVADEKKLDLRAMKVANDPLLPKLGFRLRVGDSLVQEIAGTTIPLRSAKGKLSPAIQRRVTELRALKTDYYFNRGNTAEQDIKRRELEVYGAILDEKRKVIRDELGKVEQSGRVSFQQDLLSHLGGEEVLEEAFSEHKEREEDKRKESLKALHDELRKLDSIHNSLPKKQRLFWSIEFAEVFQESGGFDIVIGNPPYVSVERIADPFMLEAGEKPSTEQKKVYKDKLGIMLDDDWGKRGATIGKRSDLYVYFYLRGLALTREGGVFVFITSNSWLDVGYGAGLQEFLLKRARVVAIYDNEAKRSFKSADVNTVIAVLEPLPLKSKPDASHVARFVMFKQPFEEAVTSDTLLAIEAATERGTINRKSEDVALARVVPMAQVALYDAGAAAEESEDDGEPKVSLTLDSYGQTYGGNKWGGKYLRAPEVYWALLALIDSSWHTLRDDLVGERYLNTGGADGFFLVDKYEGSLSEATVKLFPKPPRKGAKSPGEFLVETKFLSPILTSDETQELIVRKQPSSVCVVVRDVADLKPDSLIWAYIEWGVSEGFDKKSVTKSQKPWFRPPRQALQGAPILWQRTHRKVHRAIYNPDCWLSLRYFRYHPRRKEVDTKLIAAFLNCSIVALIKELHGVGMLGPVETPKAFVLELPLPSFTVQQATDTKVALDHLAESGSPDLVAAITKLLKTTGSDEQRPQYLHELDALCFKAWGVPDMMVREVYSALLNLIESRYKKESG